MPTDTCTVRRVAALVATIIALVLLTPGLAAAEPDPSLYEPPVDPDAPDPPVTATITQDCAAGQFVVDLVSHTLVPYHAFARVSADQVLVDFGFVTPYETTTLNIPADENQFRSITVTLDPYILGESRPEALIVVVDELVKFDCVLADPGYEFVTDCDSGEAYVRLFNNGADVVPMAVAYDGWQWAPGDVLPGEHYDWQLLLEPNETRGLRVLADLDALFDGPFTFDCPVQVPVEAPVETADTAELAAVTESPDMAVDAAEAVGTESENAGREAAEAAAEAADPTESEAIVLGRDSTDTTGNPTDAEPAELEVALEAPEEPDSDGSPAVVWAALVLVGIAAAAAGAAGAIAARRD